MNNLEIISAAIVYIENHLREPMLAKDAATAVSYSYYHFHRFFQAVVGETPGSYIRSRRLTLAAQELVHTDKRILEIALELYFESAESFSRAFKNRYSMTPTEYRNNGVDILLYNRSSASPAEQTIPAGGHRPPEIIHVPSVRICGTRFYTTINNSSCQDMFDAFNSRLIQEYPRLSARSRYCIFESGPDCAADTFSGDSGSNVFIGISLSDDEPAYGGMLIKEIGPGTYARFIHTGPVSTLLKTYRYIWGVWFPGSGYRLSQQDDFECHTERFLGPANTDSQIDIYFPIREPEP